METARVATVADMVESAHMPNQLPSRLARTSDPLVGVILDCVRALLPVENLDVLLRTGVELARTRLGAERCALWLLDFDKTTLRGTWGTDLQGGTTDEHDLRCPVGSLEEEIGCAFQAMEGWHLKRDERRYSWQNGRLVEEGTGWNTVIPIPGLDGNVGCFFLDAAISEAPLDPRFQDMMALYCALLGQLAGRRLAEERENVLSRGLESVLAAADELLAYDDLERLHRRIVELSRERLGVARAGLFVSTEGSETRFQGTWGTDWDGRTTDEHKGAFDFQEGRRFEEHGTVVVSNPRWSAFQPFPMSWFEPDGTRVDVADGWNAAIRLKVGERTLGILFVDPGRTREPLDPRKMDLLATYCALAARILERRQAQDEIRRANEQRLDSLGVLAGGLAHDFNNLLAAILGSVELLIELPRLDSDLARNRLADARDACLRGKALAGQLLTFSRGGAPVRHPIDTLPFVEEAIRSSVGAHPLRWSVQYREPPWNLLADEAQMGQVFQNLTVNACHWQPHGGSLWIGIENVRIEDGDPQVPAGTYLRIDVQDAGPGIPEQLRGRVFDPYFTTRSGGTGLGLATCHSIVARHGGRIECLPSSQGALFRLLLPATQAAPAKHPRRPDRAVDLAGARILVMDDEPVLRNMLRDMLEFHGAKTILVEDGTQAEQAWEDGIRQGAPFHAGILDLVVDQGLGGLEAARRIRSMDPNARLLVCSGYSNDPLFSDPDAYGFCGTIQKPFRLSELLDSVAKSIAGTRHGDHS